MSSTHSRAFPPRLLLAATLACGAAAAHAGRAVAEVELSDHEIRLPALPPGAPRAVLYGLPHGDGMACGLIAPGGKTLLPLVEPDDGQWPSCTGVPEAAAFDWHGQAMYVYRYLQRDTREDTAAWDAFVCVEDGEAVAVDALSHDGEPRRLSIRRAAAWAKASLGEAEAAQAGFAPSRRDTVLAERGFLAIGRNAGTGECRATPGRLPAGGVPAPLALPCRTILATTALSTRKADWLVLLVTAPDGRPQARVFEATDAAVREAGEIAPRLARSVATGQVNAVKDELRKLVGR